MAVIHDSNAVAAVICLLYIVLPFAVGHPSIVLALFAVPTRVSFVVVQPVNTMALSRSRPNVLEKSFKAIAPSKTNRYATAAVLMIMVMVSAIASFFHCLPNPVLVSMRQAMRAIAIDEIFVLFTPARCGRTIREELPMRHFFIAAFTDAPPIRDSLVSVGILNNGEASELSTGKINANTRHFLCHLATYFHGIKSPSFSQLPRSPNHALAERWAGKNYTRKRVSAQLTAWFGAYIISSFRGKINAES